MNCSYCGTRNGEGEHRCHRCGRRPGDSLKGEFTMARTDGALAKMLRVVSRPAPRLQFETAPQSAQPAPASARPAPKFTHAVQGSLFHQTPASNVIPIASYAPGLAETPRPRNAAARRKPVQEQQPSLDFLAP